jgi:cellulase/cellobiase CelA1
MKHLYCGLVVLLAAACGSSSPTAPSAPTPPPLLPAKIEVVIQDELQIGELEAAGWAFMGQARNTGAGCGMQVRGTVQFFDAAGTVIQTVEVALEPSRRVQPQEVIDWKGCCLTPANSALGKTVRVTFTWRDVACS